MPQGPEDNDAARPTANRRSPPRRAAAHGTRPAAGEKVFPASSISFQRFAMNAAALAAWAGSQYIRSLTWDGLWF